MEFILYRRKKKKRLKMRKHFFSMHVFQILLLLIFSIYVLINSTLFEIKTPILHSKKIPNNPRFKWTVSK